MPVKENKDNLPKHLRNAPKKFDYIKKAHEPEPDPNAAKELGAMNSWGNPDQYPKEYIDCQRKHSHLLDIKPLGRCYDRYTCNTCKITFTIDSTD